MRTTAAKSDRLTNILHWIIPGLLVFSMSFQTTDPAPDEGGGEFILVAMAVWIASLFVVRRWVLGYVLRLMNKKSAKVQTDQPPELTAPEKKAPNPPELLELDQHADRSAAIQLREEFVGNAFRLFRRKYGYGLLAAVVYVLLPLLLGKMAGEGALDERLGFTGFLAGSYAVYITLLFIFYRKQFRAEDAHFGFRLEHPVVSVIRGIVSDRWGGYLSVSLALMMAATGLEEIFPSTGTGEPLFQGRAPLFGSGMILAAGVHLLLFLHLRRSGRRAPNVTLLILRVFGNKEKALLTFGRLIRFWQHFGSWFTVVDPSFLSRRYRTFSFRTLAVMVLIYFGGVSIGLVLEGYLTPVVKSFDPNNHFSAAEISEFSFLPGMVLAWIAYMLYWRFAIWRSYADSLEGIRKKIERVLKKPRKADLTYKSLPMFCYDNTWRLAVSEFVQKSRVVLMDLRGYSAERRGCEYEVDFLLDTFPINGILFLVDSAGDRQLIHQLILDRWEYLRVNSPNIKAKNPVARIFISANEDEQDVQSLMDLLIEASNSTAKKP